jgi:hypothetical protein
MITISILAAGFRPQSRLGAWPLVDTRVCAIAYRELKTTKIFFDLRVVEKAQVSEIIW